MVPKKARDFRKAVAEELQLPENLVNDFIDFYWDAVRTHMSALDYVAIQIPNLGTFRVKESKIDETIEKYKVSVTKVEGKFAGHRMKKDFTDRIEKLEKLKLVINEREAKFKVIRDARKAKNNLEEQKTNMGGLDKPDSQEESCRDSIQ